MSLTPNLRKLVLTVHITSSVGWLGSVAGFLGLALVGLTSANAQMACAMYLAMKITGWFVILPLSVGALLSGLLQALDSPWGLFRHYWVLLKFLITILSIALLLMHMHPTARLAEAALEPGPLFAGLWALRVQLVADAGLAVLALLVATTLSVYKPLGMTPYGHCKHREKFGSNRPSVTCTPRWVYTFVIIALVMLFLVRYLTVGGGQMH